METANLGLRTKAGKVFFFLHYSANPEESAMFRHCAAGGAAATTFLLTVLSWSVLVSSLQYQVLRDYSGSTFFDGWDFYGYRDNLTWGNVTWLSQPDATSQQLAYINPAGNAILKVDNITNVLPGELRNSVRITTQDTFNLGTVWTIDVVHLPFGCSVWPAFWSKGILWPNDGEVDIIEGINGVDANQMAIHGLSGCTHQPGENETGLYGYSDCSLHPGCTVGELQPNSYGNAFAAAGGGVWATRFDSSGIFMWFWSRPNLPASLAQATSTSSIDDSDWGIPSGSFSSTTCDVPRYFSPQNLVLDITLCGSWAGLPLLFQRTCGSAGPTGICYNDSVVGPGSNFDNAYFEIRNVRVYTNDTTAIPPSTTNNLGVGTASSNPTNARPSSSGSRSGALSIGRFSGVSGLIIGVVVLFFCAH